MNKKIAIISISVLIILVGLIMGGLFIFRGKNIPVLGRVVTIPLVEKASAQVMDQMINKMKSIESGYLAWQMGLNMKAAEEDDSSADNENIGLKLGSTPSDVVLNLNLGFDFQGGQEVLAQKGRFDLKGGLNYNGMDYKLGFESIYRPDKIYFQATQIPAIPFFDLSSLANQWYYEDYEDLSDDVPYVDNIDEVNQVVNDFKDSLDKHNFIEVKKRMADEKIDDVPCFHYLVNIDPEKLKLFITESEDLLNNLNENVNSQALFDEMDETINKYTDMINQKGIEVWIGQNDMMMRKIAVDIRYQEKEALASYQYADINMSLTLSNVNQPISVTIPEGAKPLEELEKAVNDMTGIFNSNTSLPSTSLNLNSNTNSSYNFNSNISLNENLNNNLNQNTNTNININTNLNLNQDSDNDGLTDMEEIIYGTDSNDPDTDGDGYQDGAEVDLGYDPNGAGKLDTDADGLLDNEEEIYGTDKNNKDTDGDGYLDGEEVLNGFNPKGEGKLLTIN
ncbi:MAG: hypothetical protein U5L76_01475 [Patescibacteria group bacterium]|nr:hypothetical protein [Patescibacteria group bacterium]